MISETKRQGSFSWFSLSMLNFGTKSPGCDKAKQPHGSVLAESPFVRLQLRANIEPLDMWVH